MQNAFDSAIFHVA